MPHIHWILRHLTLRSFPNWNPIYMESGLVIWMEYAQNQILKTWFGDIYRKMG